MLMGSSGSGSFSDYPGSGKAKGGGDGGPGGLPEDRCGKAFSAQLEDLEHHAYFTKHGAPPPVGTELEVVHFKRLVAVTDGDIVGNLPTKLNYLAACIKDGYSYVGKVTVSKPGSSVVVSADFAPNST
jgi:hypothetical protein